MTRETPIALLADRIRNYSGLLRKQPIEDVFTELVLKGQPGLAPPNFGDDAAVIPWKDGFLLFAADGIMPRLLMNEPYAAGKASVMVTVNDIYSMGGRPLGMVNVLASGDEDHRRKIVQGIRKGCEKLQVPMLGGHLHPDAAPEAPALAVAILGWAHKVLHGYTAQTGDNLILAVDLSGKAGCHSVTSWDANSGKSPQELIYRLECLPMISERNWANAAKDVSNAGIVGTASIMMENSGKGAEIILDSIPTPLEIAFSDWLFSFQSFGFILSVPPRHSDQVIELFHERKINAAVIGKVIEEPKITIVQGSDVETLFDFTKDRITGIVYQPQSAH
ncbi:AIR synthase related protein [Desulfomonile tiedjei]|uniref:Selenophosphate synthase-like enzyme n=1 Tax=Desulfomonile tiedjei (strain ATCC 49306 / DSM 6799 / DCB-1) TaxID=706587 RepID=I4CEE0_DESTA|nr:AIR synthase related protein [Desulfomonile tiedjei]AFM27931.1 selenophosphate synthase-like enzyme [Desulfomonile tiedjei DSM 6799]